jgi:hypothetical protein
MSRNGLPLSSDFGSSRSSAQRSDCPERQQQLDLKSQYGFGHAKTSAAGNAVAITIT